MNNLEWQQIQHQINNNTQEQIANLLVMITMLSDEVKLLQHEVELLKGTNNEEEIS